MSTPIESGKINPAQVAAMIAEIDGVNQIVAGYEEDLAAYLFDPVNNTLPDFLVDNMNIDELTNMAKSFKDAAVDLTYGTISNVIYKAMSAVREAGTRSMTKAMFYDKAIADSATMRTETLGESGLEISRLRKMSVEQTEGI